MSDNPDYDYLDGVTNTNYYDEIWDFNVPSRMTHFTDFKLHKRANYKDAINTNIAFYMGGNTVRSLLFFDHVYHDENNYMPIQLRVNMRGTRDTDLTFNDAAAWSLSIPDDFEQTVSHSFNLLKEDYDAIEAIPPEERLTSIFSDADGDGVVDYFDVFKLDPAEWADDDRDGVGNNADAFDNDPTQTTDTDGDGFGDNPFGNNPDNAPGIFNPGQEDFDNDNVADVLDDDDDNDGLTDTQEADLGTNPFSADTDGDGIGDKEDNAPLNANPSQEDFDNDGIPDVLDPDDDNDGISDAEELVSGADGFITNKFSADSDGDGIGDKEEVETGTDGFITNPNSADTDGDGLSDKEETTAGLDGYLTNPTSADTDGDGLNDAAEFTAGTNPLDTDTDNDGIPDNTDPSPTNALDTDADGTPDLTDTDDDNDGLEDVVETNTGVFVSATNTGTDPLDTDSDDDGLSDAEEVNVIGTNPNLADTDSDGISDNLDNAPLNANPGQEDSDNDGIPDVIDSDRDGDGVNNNLDTFPDDPNESADLDGDNTGDNSDPDIDGDGVNNALDAFPRDATETVDTDNDGTGNNADTDDDGDNLSDAQEAALGTNPLLGDTDNDGVGDADDAFPLDASEQYDSDGDGIGNTADLDPYDPNIGLEPPAITYETTFHSVTLDWKKALVGNGPDLQHIYTTPVKGTTQEGYVLGALNEVSGQIVDVYKNKKQINNTGWRLLLPEDKFTASTRQERANQLNYFEYDAPTNIAAGIVGGTKQLFEGNHVAAKLMREGGFSLTSDEFSEAINDNDGFRLSAMLGFNVIGTSDIIDRGLGTTPQQKGLFFKAVPVIGAIPHYETNGVYGYTSPIYMQISVYAQDQFINKDSFTAARDAINAGYTNTVTQTRPRKFRGLVVYGAGIAKDGEIDSVWSARTTNIRTFGPHYFPAPPFTSNWLSTINAVSGYLEAASKSYVNSSNVLDSNKWPGTHHGTKPAYLDYSFVPGTNVPRGLKEPYLEKLDSHYQSIRDTESYADNYGFLVFRGNLFDFDLNNTEITDLQIKVGRRNCNPLPGKKLLYAEKGIDYILEKQTKYDSLVRREYLAIDYDGTEPGGIRDDHYKTSFVEMNGADISFGRKYLDDGYTLADSEDTDLYMDPNKYIAFAHGVNLTNKNTTSYYGAFLWPVYLGPTLDALKNSSSTDGGSSYNTSALSDVNGDRVFVPATYDGGTIENPSNELNKAIQSGVDGNYDVFIFGLNGVKYGHAANPNATLTPAELQGKFIEAEIKEVKDTKYNFPNININVRLGNEVQAKIENDSNIRHVINKKLLGPYNPYDDQDKAIRAVEDQLFSGRRVYSAEEGTASSDIRSTSENPEELNYSDWMEKKGLN